MKNNADYYISLIGTNPLPAFITLLKNCDNNTIIYLVHTTESRNNFGSKKVAENLKGIIEKRIPEVNINLVPCDKSNIKDINKCISKLVNNIKKSIRENQNARLVLDYSSGTKVMSALFAERIFNIDIEGLTTIISYVDDNQGKILEDSKFVDDRALEIKNVVNRFDISIEEITKIHGYKLEKKVEEKVYKKNIKYLKSESSIVFINENGTRICVDKVYLLNGRLLLCFKSKYLGEGKKTGVLKMELFEFKDRADKLGGNRSVIIYRSDCDKDKEEILKKDIKRAYEFEMKNRIEFVSMDSNFVEKVKDIYISEGGI